MTQTQETVGEEYNYPSIEFNGETYIRKVDHEALRAKELGEIEKRIDDLINDGHFRIYAVGSFPDDRNGIYINREDLRAGLKKAISEAFDDLIEKPI